MPTSPERLDPLTPLTAAPSEADGERRLIQDDPLRFGVGARITLSVMAEDYVDVILGALASADSSGLVVETGDVSTYLGGAEEDLQRYVTELAAGVARSGRHASLSLVLSRGCPGEVACELPGGAGPRVVPVSAPHPTGRYATAEWALYPLADGPAAGRAAGHEPDHMRDIYAAIDHAKELGTFVGSQHFVTRLEGDLGDVIATAFAGWTLVGRSVQHVTTHLTVSINSPSHPVRTVPVPEESRHA